MKVPFPLVTSDLPLRKVAALRCVQQEQATTANSPFTAFANNELSPLENCEAVQGPSPVDLLETVADGGVSLEHTIDTVTPTTDPRRKVRIKASQLTHAAAASAAAANEEAISNQKLASELALLLASPCDGQNSQNSQQNSHVNTSQEPSDGNLVTETPIEELASANESSLVAAPWSPTGQSITPLATADVPLIAAESHAPQQAVQSSNNPSTEAKRIHKLWCSRNNLPVSSPIESATQQVNATLVNVLQDDTDSQGGTSTTGTDDDEISQAGTMENDSEDADGRYDSDASIVCTEDEVEDEHMEEFLISPTTMESLSQALKGEVPEHLDEEDFDEEDFIEEKSMIMKSQQAADVVSNRRGRRLVTEDVSRALEAYSKSDLSLPSMALQPKPKNIRLRCTCTKTKCLKLYCECFSTGVVCEVGYCKCNDCYNDSDPLHHEKREAAIKKLMKKKGRVAFRNVSLEKKREIAEREGCNCKKSRCVKKYCECYSAGLVCRDNCKCEDCANDGDVPPPPIKRKRKSRAKKFRLQQAAETEAQNSSWKKKSKRART